MNTQHLNAGVFRLTSNDETGDHQVSYDLEGALRLEFETEQNESVKRLRTLREDGMIELRRLVTLNSRGSYGKLAKPFEFYPPTFFHGDMMANLGDRRFTVMRPSSYPKWDVHQFRAGRKFGPLDPLGITPQPEQYERYFGTMDRTFDLTVRIHYICKRWSTYK